MKHAQTCQVYKTMRTAGYTHAGADSVCRLAHGLMINPKLSASNILKAISITDNAPIRSVEPNSTAVQDKTYPQSSYGDDYASCLKSLQSIGVAADRAVQECSTQWKGEGNRGGNWYTSAAPKGNPINAVVHPGGGRRITVRGASIKSASERINAETKSYYSSNGKTVSASIQEQTQEIPSWVYAVTGGNPPNLHNGPSSIKSASSTDQMYNYITMRQFQHRDSINHLEADPQMEKLVHERAEQLANIAEQHRLKQAKKEPDPYEGKPYWAIVSGI